MRRATKTLAVCLGIVAGLAGLGHGYFEVLQGNTRPAGLLFPSMGPPCDPAVMWNSCEPAMSILPNLRATGLLAILIGAAMIIWSAAFLHTRHGAVVLGLLSLALLLFGGGIFPPLIGLISSVAASRINRPICKQPGRMTRLAARLWPWPLVILLVWLLGQFVVGYFLNDLLKNVMGLGLLLILTMLPLSLYAAYAHDAVQGNRVLQAPPLS
jgi:hypothetical protein